MCTKVNIEVDHAVRLVSNDSNCVAIAMSKLSLDMVLVCQYWSVGGTSVRNKL